MYLMCSIEIIRYIFLLNVSLVQYLSLRLTQLYYATKLIFRTRPTSLSWRREFRYTCLGGSRRYCDGHTYDSWFRYMLPTISRVQGTL